MGTLLESIKESISPETIRSVATSTDESTDGIKKGLETAAATVLGTLATRAGDSGFLSHVMSIVSSFGTQTLSAAAGAGGASVAGGETGASFLATVFGTNRAATEEKIAQAAGLRSSVGSTILATAAPLVLGTLSTKLSGGTTGLASALTNEMPSLRGVLPAGLPGVPVPNFTSRAVQEKNGGEWLWPVLLVAAILIFGLVYYFRGDRP